MKKFDIKSVILGFVIGTIGITTAFAAGGIKSAAYSNAKLTLNGVSVPLNNSLVEIVKDNEKDMQLYMPVRELIEYLGYNIGWNKDTLTVELSKNFTPDEKVMTNKTDNSFNQNQQKTIEINIEDELPKEGYIIIGEYSLNVGSTVRFNITAEGLGNLQVGFIEPTDNPSTANLRILTISNSNMNGKCSINEPEGQGRTIKEEMAGIYKLYIQNTGNNPLSKIKGTVHIDD